MPSTNEMSSRFVRNSAFSTVAGIGSAFAGFFSSVIIARTLGVDGSGVVAVALWVVALVATFADLGVGASLTRYLPELTARNESEQARRLTAFLFRPLLLACFIAATAFAFYATYLWAINAVLENGSDMVSLWRAQPLMWLVIGAASVLQALDRFAMGYLRGMQRFDRVALLTIISVSLHLGAVAAGSIEFGVVGALGGYCIGSIVPAAVALPLIHGDLQISNELKLRVTRFARYAWAGGLASAFIWSRMEIFFLDRSWGSEAVGLFAVGLTFSNLAVQGPMLLTGGLLPYFSESFGRNAIDDIRSSYATATRIVGFLVFPACFGLAAIMPAALPLIYGQAFADVVPAAMVLVAASSFPAVASVGSNLVYGLDRSDFIFVSGATGAMLSVLTGLTLIPMFGVMGAACTRAAIQVAMVVFGTWFITRRLNCRTPVGDLGRLLIAAAVCAIAAHACIALIPGIASLPVSILTGALVYVAAVRLLHALPKSDVVRLKSLCQRLPKPLRISSQFGLQLMFGS
jgi:O-antigen/teichoic acid export membrane protein